MKPVTKNEIAVTRLSKKLPDVNKSQLVWVRKHLYNNEGYLCKGEVFCSCCGEVFNMEHYSDHAACPHCGNKLTIKKSRKSNVTDHAYFTILSTCNGWQVVRNFKVTRNGKKCPEIGGGYVNYYFHEVGQVWFNAKGERVVMGVGRTMAFVYYDTWSSQPLSVKRNNLDDYMFNGAIYPRINLLPQLKRSGYREMERICAPTMIRMLLSSPLAETLLKTGQEELFYALSRRTANLKKYWTAVRICLRHHYTISNIKDWIDYIGMLIQLDKDIHNPHYVCPEDLKAAHDKALNALRRMRERERIAANAKRLQQMKEKALKDEQNYKKAKAAFFGMLITGGGIVIRPLSSVAEFFDEGAAMHHCVAQCHYYQKADSLILTARDAQGNRLETIEVDLKSFKIIQSRGVCNQDSPKHKEIVKLMNAHMGDVKRLARPKTKKTAKATRLAAAA